MATVRDWKYYGKLTRVVDGDTVLVDLDMGMRVWQKDVYIRLVGIDAPEKKTQEGKDAKAFLEQHILPGDELSIVSHQFDKYGRLLATVASPNGEDLSYLMLSTGHAVVYE